MSLTKKEQRNRNSHSYLPQLTESQASLGMEPRGGELGKREMKWRLEPMTGSLSLYLGAGERSLAIALLLSALLPYHHKTWGHHG